MSGGKGGSSTSEVKIPAWLQDAAKTNIAKANEVAKIGYVPYYGPDVAAFNPMQTSAFQNVADASAAFGLSAPTNGMAGMPQSQTFAGGVQGYSSAPMYQQALDALKANAPGQYDFLTGMFIDPVTGAAPTSFPQPAPAPSPVPGPITSFFSTGNGSGGGYTAPTQTGGGYTSLRDMFDGGGPGTGGSTFSGGPLSGALNAIGVSPVRTTQPSNTTRR